MAKCAKNNDLDVKDDLKEATRQSLLAFPSPREVRELSKASSLSSLYYKGVEYHST